MRGWVECYTRFATPENLRVGCAISPDYPHDEKLRLTPRTNHFRKRLTGVSSGNEGAILCHSAPIKSLL